MSKPDRSVIASVGQTVLCLVVAPVALLGVLYFVSQAAEIRFGHLVLGLMVVVFARWYLRPDGIRTVSGGMDNPELRERRMADQGVAGSETPSTGVVTGTILVPSEAPTPNYFWIVLTEAAFLGWIVALLW